MPDKIEIRTEILKVDDELGLVFGWGFICTEGGEDHHDTQEDNIPVGEMLKATADFMRDSRVMDANHQREQTGDVVFAMPMTKQIASAYNMDLPKNDDGRDVEGFMMCVKPHSDEELQKFKNGTYTGFSLDGEARRVPVQ